MLVHMLVARGADSKDLNKIHIVCAPHNAHALQVFTADLPNTLVVQGLSELVLGKVNANSSQYKVQFYCKEGPVRCKCSRCCGVMSMFAHMYDSTSALVPVQFACSCIQCFHACSRCESLLRRYPCMHTHWTTCTRCIFHVDMPESWFPTDRIMFCIVRHKNNMEAYRVSVDAADNTYMCPEFNPNISQSVRGQASFLSCLNIVVYFFARLA